MRYYVMFSAGASVWSLNVQCERSSRSRRYQEPRYQRRGCGMGTGGTRRLPAAQYHIWPRKLMYCAVLRDWLRIAAAGKGRPDKPASFIYSACRVRRHSTK